MTALLDLDSPGRRAGGADPVGLHRVAGAGQERGCSTGCGATTHHGAMPCSGEVAPRDRSCAKGSGSSTTARIVVSAGVSAGIDMSLHVVERLLGTELAEEAAGYMEYHWDRNEEGLQDQGL